MIGLAPLNDEIFPEYDVSGSSFGQTPQAVLWNLAETGDTLGFRVRRLFPHQAEWIPGLDDPAAQNAEHIVVSAPLLVVLREVDYVSRTYPSS